MLRNGLLKVIFDFCDLRVVGFSLAHAHLSAEGAEERHLDRVVVVAWGL